MITRTDPSHVGTKVEKRLLIRIFFVNLFDKICCLVPWRALDRQLKKLTEKQGDIFFVQIGANDGVIYDPIHKYVKRGGWRGILVEPVRHYFDKLKGNYRDTPNLVFENVAISDKDETRDFFRVDERYTFLPKWCAGLGTFDLDVLLTHRWAIPNIRDYVVKETVRCIPLNTLLEKHLIKTIELLLIDTEGYDHEVLKQIDFGRIKPDTIVFEHQYIEKQDLQECDKLLKQHGYSIDRHLGNTMACLTRVGDSERRFLTSE